MDGLNLKDLNLKLMNFLRDNEGKDFSFNDIEKFFSYSELMFILEYSTFSDKMIDILSKVELSQEFQDVINRNVFDKIENEKDVNYIVLGSDNILLESMSKQKNDNIYNYCYYLKTDEARIKALNIKKLNEDDIEIIVKSFDDDNLKLKYLHMVRKSSLEDVLESIKDEKLRLQLIERYPNSSSFIIAKVENEDMRVYYYEKYFKKLRENGKKRIFKTFSEETKIKYLDRYWKVLSSEEKIGHLSVMTNEEEVLKRISELSEFEKIKLLYEMENVQKNLKEKIAETINYKYSKRLLKFIVKQSMESVIFDLNINNLFRRINDKQKLKIIEYRSDLEVLPILATMKKFKNAEKHFNHRDDLPCYDKAYDSLIFRYAKEYKLNSEHLLSIVKLSSLEILKNIRNENLQQLVNLDEESFKKLLSLFETEKNKMDFNSFNDNINIYLQRAFKLQNPDIINISSHIRLAIQDSESEKVLSLMDTIVSEYDISKILKKHNYTSEEFLKLLINNKTIDEKTTSCLLEITNGYIVFKRNEYIQNNLLSYQKRFGSLCYDKKSSLKFMIENFPIEVLRERIYNKNRITLEKGYTQEEVDFINHPTALETIIHFRRDPSKFDAMPEVAKKYMTLFNKLFEKNFSAMSISGFPTDSIKKSFEPYTSISQSLIGEILLELDSSCLKSGILANDELYQKLTDVLTKYKLFGFSDVMRDSFSTVDLWADSSTLCSLIKYFPVIFNDLNEKVNRGEIKGITLPALLDMAQCYSMDSNKLSILFGKDNVRLLSSNPGPNSSSWSKEKRLDKAQKYLKTMHERKYVSVPSCDQDFDLTSGKKMNVVIGNFSEPINLTYGERTGACMRIGGHADSLFDACLKNDNCFHIRFSCSEDDSFVSRVSGFRNGNTVFLNELRYSVDGRYSNEDVREACIMAARLLIDRSKDSATPIENVVVSPCYVMDSNETTNLNVSDIKKGVGNFYTDISSDSATILATSNPDDSLVPVRLGNIGVKKYSVQRGKIRMYEGNSCIEYLDRIELVDQILSGKSIDDTTTKPKKDIAFCYCGEDWYVTIDSKGNIGEYVMENSNKKEIANREKKECIRQIKEKIGISNTIEETNINSVGSVRR